MLVVEVVNRIAKCLSVKNVILVGREQLPEDVLVLVKNIQDEEIGVTLIHVRIVFHVVRKSSGAIGVLENFVSMDVTEELLEEPENPRFAD